MKSGSFPLCWRKANITPIPKGASASSSPSEYRPISITPILSKIYERLLTRRLVSYCNLHDVIPPSQFGFRKGLGTCDALLTLTHQIQSSLDKGYESRVVAVDFSAAFDLVNHEALIYKLQLYGIGGNLLSIFRNFLTSRSQRVAVDGKFSETAHVLSGVPQGSVLGPLFYIIFTADIGLGLENNIISYADDTTIFSSIPSPHHRDLIAASLNRDLARITSWCEQWGMKLNPKKTQSLLISRSRTILPPHPSIQLSGESVEDVLNLRLLGVSFDKKLTFEHHIRSLSSSIARKIGLLRKCYKTFNCDATLRKSFYAFILPHFEYCSPVWMSAADCHLNLLDRSLNSIRFILPDLPLDLAHRRRVGALSIFFKIFNNNQHPLHSFIPDQFVPARLTRYAINLNSLAMNRMNVSTAQYFRSFVPQMVELWNSLVEDVVRAPDITAFKTKVNAFLQT